MEFISTIVVQVDATDREVARQKINCELDKSLGAGVFKHAEIVILKAKNETTTRISESDE